MSVKTQEELVKNAACNCLFLPCVHNPEISDDIAIEVKIRGHKTPKGVTFIYLDKSKFQVQEETVITAKMIVL